MTRPKRARIQLLAVVSDLHCGSTVGLMHPESEQESGNSIGFGRNVHQAWLWQCWQQMEERVQEICDGWPYALLVNGDATEGIHHRTTEVVATTIAEHVAIATKCLKFLSGNAKRTLVVKGTECHTHNMETVLAQKLGAVDGVAKDKWLFRIHGCLIDATHHVGVTSRAYLEASQYSIAMGNARLNYIRAGHEVPRLFLRAHRHCGGTFSDGDSMMGITAAWQFLTRHGRKVVPDSIPRPSAQVFDWRGKPEGALPAVHDITFAPPADEITEF